MLAGEFIVLPYFKFVFRIVLNDFYFIAFICFIERNSSASHI